VLLFEQGHSATQMPRRVLLLRPAEEAAAQQELQPLRRLDLCLVGAGQLPLTDLRIHVRTW